MIRLFVLIFVWLFLALGAALAVPLRPLYVPETPPLPAKPPSSVNTDLKGSTWKGKYLTTDRTFIFEPDGSLTYILAKSTIKNYGSWRVEGKTLTFESRTKVMQFRGDFQNDNSISGEWQTRTGKTTPTVLQRMMP